MLSIVIPVVDNFDITTECLKCLQHFANNDNEIIIVDNASNPAYDTYELDSKIVRNDQNIGVYPSLLQGIRATTNDIVVTMHNDVLLWENGWDDRILVEFEKDPLLGLVGLFGAPGVGFDGGRSNPQSNMIGYKFGQPGFMHGHVLIDSHPAVVFDSLFLCFRKDYFWRANALFDKMPPHHWFDRIITLAMVKCGYHARTVGIKFDHGGGMTSSNGRTTMDEFTRTWCEQNNLPIVENPDYTLYKYGERLFQSTFADMLPLQVDAHYNYRKG